MVPTASNSTLWSKPSLKNLENGNQKFEKLGNSKNGSLWNSGSLKAGEIHGFTNSCLFCKLHGFY